VLILGRAFTLVELLVVIVIISLLMALVLPAIQTARESGRRTTCANNMHNVSTAMLGVADSKRCFPGYANVVSRNRASWVVLLPHLEHNDLFQSWQNKPIVSVPAPASELTTAVAWAHERLSVLICPSDAQKQGTNPLSYVVNCGSATTANDNFPPGTAWARSE